MSSVKCVPTSILAHASSFKFCIRNPFGKPGFYLGGISSARIAWGGSFPETDFTRCRTVILPGMQGLHSLILEIRHWHRDFGELTPIRKFLTPKDTQRPPLAGWVFGSPIFTFGNQAIRHLGNQRVRVAELPSCPLALEWSSSGLGGRYFRIGANRKMAKQQPEPPDPRCGSETASVGAVTDRCRRAVPSRGLLSSGKAPLMRRRSSWKRMGIRTKAGTFVCTASPSKFIESHALQGNINCD